MFFFYHQLVSSHYFFDTAHNSWRRYLLTFLDFATDYLLQELNLYQSQNQLLSMTNLIYNLFQNTNILDDLWSGICLVVSHRSKRLLRKVLETNEYTASLFPSWLAWVSATEVSLKIVILGFGTAFRTTSVTVGCGLVAFLCRVGGGKRKKRVSSGTALMRLSGPTNHRYFNQLHSSSRAQVRSISRHSSSPFSSFPDGESRSTSQIFPNQTLHERSMSLQDPQFYWSSVRKRASSLQDQKGGCLCCRRTQEVRARVIRYSYSWERFERWGPLHLCSCMASESRWMI